MFEILMVVPEGRLVLISLWYFSPDAASVSGGWHPDLVSVSLS